VSPGTLFTIQCSTGTSKFDPKKSSTQAASTMRSARSRRPHIEPMASTITVAPTYPPMRVHDSKTVGSGESRIPPKR